MCRAIVVVAARVNQPTNHPHPQPNSTQKQRHQSSPAKRTGGAARACSRTLSGSAPSSGASATPICVACTGSAPALVRYFVFCFLLVSVCVCGCLVFERERTIAGSMGLAPALVRVSIGVVVLEGLVGVGWACRGSIDRDISPPPTTTNPNTYPGSLCLVYDFLEGGSLAGLLRDRSKGYDLFQVRFFMGGGGRGQGIERGEWDGWVDSPRHSFFLPGKPPTIALTLSPLLSIPSMTKSN